MGSHRRLRDSCPWVREGRDLFEKDGPYAVRVNDEFTIDVMPSAGGHGWAELERYIEERLIDGARIRVLGLEGLLLTKAGMRDRDKADATVLMRAIEALRSGKPA